MATKVLARLEAPRQHTSVGVVVPFDFALDHELWQMVPDGVAVHVTRTPYLDLAVGVAQATELSDDAAIEQGVRCLSVIWPASTVYLCASGSFVHGLEGEAHLREAMETAGAVRAVTTSGALVDALAALETSRVGIATPYDLALTERLAGFLAESGHDVTRTAYLDLTGNIPQVSADTVRELARAASADDVDVVYLSCTNMPTLDLIAELEEELGRPVLSSNLVSMWSALRSVQATGNRGELLFRRTQQE